MLILQMEVWNLRRREICFCTVRYPRLPSQRMMTRMTAVPEVFPAVERAFPGRAVIIKKDKKKQRNKEAAFFCAHNYAKNKLNVKNITKRNNKNDKILSEF